MTSESAANRRTVMILTATIDLGADRVVARLVDRLIPVFRLNTDHLLSRAQVQMNEDLTWWARDGPHDTSLDRVSSVWFRKLRYPACAAEIDPQIHAYVCREANSMLRAFLNATPHDCKWMSPIANIDRAELKPVQLESARRVGLRIPRTVITSNPETVRAFSRSVRGAVIGKPVRSGYVRTSGGDYGIFTRRLDEVDLASLNDALPCPIIVQEEVVKKYDIRVTLVGKRLFAAAIDSQSDPDASVDWRRTSNPNLPHYQHELPDDVARKCLALARHLGLEYGAMDFALTPDGDYVFLEVNPNGEWLWIEDQLGYPISGEIADWLAGR